MRRALVATIIACADGALYLLLCGFVAAGPMNTNPLTFWHPGLMAFCGLVAGTVGAGIALAYQPPTPAVIPACRDCKALAAITKDRDELRRALVELKP